MRNLDVWYARLDVDGRARALGSRSTARPPGRPVPSARRARKDSLKALAKLTRMVDGEPRIISDPPLIVPIADLDDDADPRGRGCVRDLPARLPPARLPPERRRLLERYRSWTSPARWSAWAVSGPEAWVVLLIGRDDGDPLFLQVKEARPSVLEPSPRASSTTTRASGWSRASG